MIWKRGISNRFNTNNYFSQLLITFSFTWAMRLDSICAPDLPDLDLRTWCSPSDICWCCSCTSACKGSRGSYRSYHIYGNRNRCWDCTTYVCSIFKALSYIRSEHHTSCVMLLRIFIIYWVILPDCCESDEPFLIEIHRQWVVWRHSHVQPEVPLVSVHQERIVDVLGHHHGLVQGNLEQIRSIASFFNQIYGLQYLTRMIDDEYSPAPRRSYRLHDPSTSCSKKHRSRLILCRFYEL